jgi:hypothetical protein
MSYPTTSNEPFAGRDPDRWGEIFYNLNHTAQTWACVRAAIGHADDTMTRASAAAIDPDHPGLRRGSPLWSEAAVSSYQLLSDTGAYSHVDTDPVNRCVADVEAVRTWLTAPMAAPGLESTTVADKLGVDDDFLLDDEDRPGRLAKLLSTAQLVGVLRTDSAHLQLWHIADNDGDLDGHRLAVLGDNGVVLSSGLLAVDHLADDSLTGIDAAVDLLSNAAVIANDVLTVATRAQDAPPATAPRIYSQLDQPAPTAAAEQEPVPVWVAGYRVGRAFPPPGQGQPGNPSTQTQSGPPVLGRPPTRPRP